MKLGLYKVCVSMIFLVSFPFNAAAIQSGQWTTPAIVESVEIHDNAYFRVTTQTTDNTSAVCSSANGIYWWPATDALSQEIYSTILAAYASSKKISVVYTDECNISSKRLRHVILSN